MEKFLGQLLEKFLGDVEFEVPVAFDKEVHSVLGLFAIGRNVASFIVCNGKVDLHDLPEIAADVPLANLVLKSLHVPALSDTPFLQLLLQGWAAGPSLLWWWRQWLVIAGLALDNHLPSLGLPSSAVEARVQARKRKRRDPDLEDAFSKEHGSKAPKVQEDLGKLFGLEGKWATHARRKLLVRYLLASRRWFSSCRAVGMAVDASRVGGWETLRGLVCARQPGGASFRAALLPPQDRGGEGNKNRGGGTTTKGEKSKTHENPRKPTKTHENPRKPAKAKPTKTHEKLREVLFFESPPPESSNLIPSLPQDMQELKTGQDLELTLGVDTRAEWRRAAECFLTNTAPEVKPSKMYRLASFHWLVSVDNMLRVSCGFGLEAFLPGSAFPDGAASSSDSIPRPPRLLILSMDQGSVGWCLAQFLLFRLRLNCVLFFDPSHRVWNDIKLAVQGSNLWPCIVLWGVPFNVHYGPLGWCSIVEAGTRGGTILH